MIKIYLREEKANKIRREGKVPGVIYGPNIGSQKIYADDKDIKTLYKEHEGGLFEIYFEDQKMSAILREIQIHPLTNQIIHFDLYVPSLSKKVTTTIPIEFVGEAPVTKKGGVLNFGLHELDIEAFPQDLPEKIVIDLSLLNEIGETIYVKDLKISSKIKVLLEENTPIVSVIKEREEKFLEEPPTSLESSND